MKWSWQHSRTPERSVIARHWTVISADCSLSSLFLFILLSSSYFVCCLSFLQLVRFLEIPSLTEATNSQLENVITALNDLCQEWRFTVICSLFVSLTEGVRVVVDVNSFIRHLSPEDTKTWAERWRAESTYASPTARATREDLNGLEKNEPGSLVLDSWTDYWRVQNALSRGRSCWCFPNGLLARRLSLVCCVNDFGGV